MNNLNEINLNEQIKRQKSDLIFTSRIIFIIIIILLLILTIFGYNFFYSSVGFEHAIDKFELNEKIVDEDYGLPLAKDEPINTNIYNYRGYAFPQADSGFSSNKWYSLGSANQLKKESFDVPLFDLSYLNENYQDELIDITSAYEVSTFYDGDIQSDHFYKNKEVWDKAIFNAEKLFSSEQMTAGVEGKAIGFYERALVSYYMEDDVNAHLYYSLALKNDTYNEVPMDERFARLFYQKGITLMNEGNLSSAFDEFSFALKADPSHYQSLFMRGLILLNLNENVEAIEDIHKVIKLAPDFGKAYIALGYAYYLQEDYGKALEMLDEGIHHDPNDGMAYLYKGFVFECINMHNGALQAYEKARELLSDSETQEYIDSILDEMQ